MQCKDIDEVATKENIRDALKNRSDHSVCTSPQSEDLGSTQMPVQSLPAEAALKLLAAGKVKIGWIVCRFREQASLKRCFRYLEFRYIVAKCTGDSDRRKKCKKRGENSYVQGVQS